MNNNDNPPAFQIPEQITGGRRLAVVPSEWLDDWYVPYSPRNDNSNAEGPWGDWVKLARKIIEIEIKRQAFIQSQTSTTQPKSP